MAQKTRAIPQQINLVGEGTTFEGTLRASSDVRTSGRVIGRLEVEGKAIVAETGTVEGEVVATNADIAGHVQGEIYITEQLVLKSTARVDGNIETDRLVVEEGAVFTGECRMGAPARVTPGADEAAASDQEDAGEAPEDRPGEDGAEGSVRPAARPVASDSSSPGTPQVQ